ncbi:hypothetical protein LTR84_012267 [Exophiala bonariae]|uniref:RNA polymerase alpha subunit C-terminal domain-containing protein n=1 Tax=Exophiala bonariae TaxID=1690606 RepID=A0AAV9NIA8_9EURO|nr:hypothetical protein LTR84_012267 [Exophiala bonariae]
MPQKKRKHRHASNESKLLKSVTRETRGEAIEVPDESHLGNKLANSQETNCNTAHVRDHKSPRVHRTVKCELGIQTTDQKNSWEEHAILNELVKQELRNIEGIRRKEFQYLKGVPKDEALRQLDSMGLEELRKLAAQLKSLGDGETTAEKAMYDDDESGDNDTPRCLTPPAEE